MIEIIKPVAIQILSWLKSVDIRFLKLYPMLYYSILLSGSSGGLDIRY